MTCRSFVRILTVCAAAGALLATSASACETGRCEVSAQSAETKPLKLNAFRRKPIATSATRASKNKNGEYAKVTVKHRPKQVAASPLTSEPLSPAAAQAFASYELARVRVVTLEETNGAGFLTDTVSPSVAVVGVDSVQVVSAEEINDIDRQADSSSAVSLDTLSRNLAASKAEGDSWFQRMLTVLGGAFAAVAALVRMLLG